MILCVFYPSNFIGDFSFLLGSFFPKKEGKYNLKIASESFPEILEKTYVKMNVFQKLNKLFLSFSSRKIKENTLKIFLILSSIQKVSFFGNFSKSHFYHLFSSINFWNIPIGL